MFKMSNSKTVILFYSILLLDDPLFAQICMNYNIFLKCQGQIDDTRYLYMIMNI